VTRPPDRERIAEAVRALRDPLARIALAVSATQRAVSREAREQRAESVSAALADADARIEELLRALGATASAPAATHDDCRESFASVCERARPAALARGLELRRRLPNEAIPGDAAQVARAALRLLRVAFAWTGERGSVELSLESASPAAALVCVATPPGASARTGQLSELLERFALAEGVRVRGLESLASRELSLALELRAPLAC
jgi:hypothetical protein